MAISRAANALQTTYKDICFRSQTEARWAVFFDTIEVQYIYEPETIKLSNGMSYIPDFFIRDFNCFFEVKPSDEMIVSEECIKARCLAHDRPNVRVWLAMGGPAPNTPNILPLDLWPINVSIEEILAVGAHRYWLHEDRRDERVYWLHSEEMHGYVVGGPGKSTPHFREPLNHKNVEAGYNAARTYKF